MVSEIRGIDGNFLGLPINGLRTLERREHRKEWITAKSILDKYFRENSTDLEKVVDTLLGLMEVEIAPEKVREGQIKEYYDKLKDADRKFGWITKFLGSVPARDKKELYLSYTTDIFNKLKKRIIPTVETNLHNKEEWDRNDPLILPYLHEYLHMVVKLKREISDAPPGRVDAVTERASFLIGFYSIVLYGYVRGRLSFLVTSKRYSELVLLSGPVRLNVSENISKALETFSSLPIGS